MAVASQAEGSGARQREAPVGLKEKGRAATGSTLQSAEVKSICTQLASFLDLPVPPSSILNCS